MLAILSALGAPVEGPEDLPAAATQRRAEVWRRVLEPVSVAWDGWLSTTLRTPSAASGAIGGTLQLEDGSSRDVWLELESLPVTAGAELDGTAFVERRLSLPEPLPPGYHRLRIEIGGTGGESLVISSPTRAPRAANARQLGLFLPLYALHSSRSIGVGDLTDLAQLRRFATERGVDLVGSTPLLAAFLDHPFEPSPYSPASRLFFNELYLDLERSPELERCAEARELLTSPGLRRQVAELREQRLVDWGRTYALKRRVLEALARCFFDGPAEARTAFERHRHAEPRLDDYARFRATAEREARPWPEWPGADAGALPERADDEDARRYHLYAQWLLHGQLADAAGPAAAGLYLDLPLGVHRESYDVFRERGSFALTMSGGAPPDSLNAAGQDWGFPPLHPEGIRETGYRYPIACIRTLLTHASALRVDHVMGLHRLFWVPRGAGASDGAYVRYRPDELYAILILEATRRGAVLVGEDLGTVPPEVRESMAEHGLRRSSVLQFEVRPHDEQVIPEPPADALAALNTHDTPSFAGFWSGRDLDLAHELGFLDAETRDREHGARAHTRWAVTSYLRRRGLLPHGDAEPEAADVARACLHELAAGPAETVLVNAEDLWGETQPQNVPGTGQEQPNWRRKARYALEEIAALPAVTTTLETLHAARREAR